jgi:dimethylamine/trimethylamine dehydrogenase
MVSYWSQYTEEQERVHRRLSGVGVQIELNRELVSFDGTNATLSCTYTESKQTVPVDNLVLVTCRTPQDGLYHELVDAIAQNAEGAPKSVKRIGDAEAPSIIATAIYAGHKYARELDCEIDPDMPAKYDRILVG